MRNLAKLIKYLPIIMQLIDIVTKMIDAGKVVFKADKPTPQDVELRVQKDKLVSVGYDLVPTEAKMYASEPEIKEFTDKLVIAVDAVVDAVRSFIPLLKENIGPQPKA